MPAIPMHIVSGFLGSGKTTFLKEIISQMPQHVKIGIIQNEFAPASIDGYEIKKCHGNFRLMEINNGSVFCVCLLGEFVSSLSAFIGEYSPGIIILEASGLSDVTSMAEIFSHPLLSGKVYIAMNWCIVDAVNFHRTGKMLQQVIRQIRMADIVLINKTDLAGERVANLASDISGMNPYAEIVTTCWCRVPFDRTAPAGPGIRFPSPGPLPRPDIHSMVIRTTRPIHPGNLLLFLQKWAPLAYRIKGFVNTGDQSKTAVQCTFGDIDVRQVDYWAGPSELIALTDRFTLREWSRSFRDH